MTSSVIALLRRFLSQVAQGALTFAGLRLPSAAFARHAYRVPLDHHHSCAGTSLISIPVDELRALQCQPGERLEFYPSPISPSEVLALMCDDSPVVMVGRIDFASQGFT